MRYVAGRDASSLARHLAPYLRDILLEWLGVPCDASLDATKVSSGISSSILECVWPVASQYPPHLGCCRALITPSSATGWAS